MGMTRLCKFYACSSLASSIFMNWPVGQTEWVPHVWGMGLCFSCCVLQSSFPILRPEIQQDAPTQQDRKPPDGLQASELANVAGNE